MCLSFHNIEKTLDESNGNTTKAAKSSGVFALKRL